MEEKGGDSKLLDRGPRSTREAREQRVPTKHPKREKCSEEGDLLHTGTRSGGQKKQKKGWAR